MDGNENNPSTLSIDYVSMQPYWEKVSSIMGGLTTMKQSGETYLPKFNNENQKDYEFRLRTSKFTNIFRDIVEMLTSKPFSKPPYIKNASDLPEEFSEYEKNVDCQGNNLHVFANDVMFNGISNSIHWIFVDHDRTDGALKTIADEKRAGVRPYFISIQAQNMICVETAKINGQEEFVHIRFRSDRVQKNGYNQTLVKRIFEYTREQFTDETGLPTGKYGSPVGIVWELEEKSERKVSRSNSRKISEEPSWKIVGDPVQLSIDVIPVVPFVAGRRIGNSWTFHPMLNDAADLQIELYHQETSLKYSKDHTAFPMLSANGVTLPVNKKTGEVTVPVGPKSVLGAPMGADGKHGEWKFIEPSSSSLRFLADDINETKKDLRELGRQPLTGESGNLTVVTTQFAAQKGNSAVQQLSLNLKDCLENAFYLMALWKGTPELEVELEVFKDFDIQINGQDDIEWILKLRDSGGLSFETVQEELKRRGVLSDSFDSVVEAKRLLEEIEEDKITEDIPVSGKSQEQEKDLDLEV